MFTKLFSAKFSHYIVVTKYLHCSTAYVATYYIFKFNSLLYLSVLQGIKDRDEFVFTEVRAKRRIPIVMLQGGGFQVKLLNNINI